VTAGCSAHRPEDARTDLEATEIEPLREELQAGALATVGPFSLPARTHDERLDARDALRDVLPGWRTAAAAMSFPAMHPALLAITLALFCGSPSAVRGPSHPASHQQPSHERVAWGSSDPESGVSSLGRSVLDRDSAMTSAGAAAIETNANVFVRIVASHPLDALAAHLRDARWRAVVSNLPSGGDHAGAWRALAALVAVVLNGRAAKRRAASCAPCANATARFARRPAQSSPGYRLRLFLESGGGRSGGLTPRHGGVMPEGEEAPNAIVGTDGIGGHEAQLA